MSDEQVIPRLRKLAKNRRYEKLESAWVEAAEGGWTDTDEMFSVLEVLAKHKQTELADTLLGYWLMAIEKADRFGDALGIVKRGAALFPASHALRDAALRLYPKVHPGAASLEILLETALGARDVSLPDAMARVDTCLALQPGTYVMNQDRPGRVTAVETAGLCVTFPDGEDVFTVAQASSLRPLPADDFRALAVFENERLTALAQEDPPEFVRMAVKTFGPELKYRELRESVAEVVPPKTWAKWWGKAKIAVKRSPFVEVSDGAQPTFRLRRRAVTYEAQVLSQFTGAADWEARIAVVLEYLEHVDAGHEADAKLMARFDAELAKRVRKTEHAGEAMGSLAALCAVRKHAPADAGDAPPSVEEVLAAARTPADLLRQVGDDAVARCLVAFVRESLPDRWPELCAGMWPGASPGMCDWLLSETPDAELPEVLPAVARSILRSPDRNAPALVWLWRTLCSTRCPAALQEIDRVEVLLDMFRSAEALERPGRFWTDAWRKDAGRLLRGALSMKKYAYVRKVVQDSPERGQQIRERVERNFALRDEMRAEIIQMVSDARPDLFEESVPVWKEDANYTTEKSLRKYEAEHDHLVKVLVPENIKDIGRAREFGDLSENAEYTAALERRERLAERDARMKEELAKAKVITPDMVRTDTVSIASAVRVRNVSTGEEERFVFLGPWDADPDNGVYSYKAPLSHAFMGKAPGEEVSFQSGPDERRWEILEITSAL